MRSICCAVVMSLLAGGASAQCQSVWGMASASGPSARSYHAMAFDPALDRVVLFGGSNRTVYRADLWSWEGAAWSLVSDGAGGPAARRGMGFAVDVARGRDVVFGGTTTGGIVGDTWEWNGSAWSPGPAGPSARAHMAMAFDPPSGKVVLFGGWSGGLAYSSQTWLYDGGWTLAAPAHSPPARAFTAMAYDEHRARLVLFGGLLNSPASTYYDDTWEWDGADWTHAAPAASPPGRGYHAMAYDGVSRRVLVFGGFSFDLGAFDDVWAYDGSTWAPVNAGGPAARQNSAMAFDPGRGYTVMFGGQNSSTYMGDTWLLTGCPGCRADFNGDGQADFFDYLDFAQAFDAEDPAADFNGDQQVDFFDYLDFVLAFDAGC